MKYKSIIAEKMKNPKEAFKNEDGAIDLASIMVGIIVIGLIGGVIAATIFAVIPWTQDNAAKHQLESIHTAENAYMGFSSASLSNLPAGAKQNTFASSAELAAAGLLAQNSHYCAAVPSDSKTYSAYSLSATGKIWVSDDKKAKPTVFNGTLPSACPDLITATTSVGSTTPDGKTTYSYTSDGAAKEDISSPGKGDGTTAATSGTLTNDGSGDYVPENPAWLNPYGTKLNQTLTSPQLEITKWSYDNARTVAITFATDGTFNGLGGSWEAHHHFDLLCYNPTTKAFSNFSGRISAEQLHGGSYGPNSDTEYLSCPENNIVAQVYLRQAIVEDFPDGNKSWHMTIPNLSEGFVNALAPKYAP